MAFTLQNSINFAQPFVDYIPVTAGFGQEPAISVASMIRNTLLQPPMTWPFNRDEITFSTVVGQQDYPQSFAGQTPANDFGFVERVTLTDDAGNVFEITDVMNNEAIPKVSGNAAVQSRPDKMCVLKIAGTGTATQTVTFRFFAVPDAIYSVVITYQKAIPQFGPYFITAVGNQSGGNTAYTGVFDPYSLAVSDIAQITGCTNTVNNGKFSIVSVTPTTLTVANGAGSAESNSNGFVSDFSWTPIPDQYSDIYNNLFLAEVLSLFDDNREQIYRQRGIAAFLSKSAGLTDLQKNWFLDLWLKRTRQRQGAGLMEQLGTQGRAV